jgi:hypothetical protein
MDKSKSNTKPSNNNFKKENTAPFHFKEGQNYTITKGAFNQTMISSTEKKL